MRPPDFWRRSPASPLARLLSPFASIYGAAAGARLSRRGARAGLPTIVVGGFTAGGDGKTPVALALAALLSREGERPAFLTRGYGRRRGARREPFLVDPLRDTALEAGDEPLLLARCAPTIVAVDRAAGAIFAREIGAAILLLDDGLQSRRLAADLVLAVVDCDYGAGNGLCLPAGPLRAPLARQMEAVDAIVAIGRGAAGDAVLHLARLAGKTIFRAHVRPDARIAAQLAGKRALAFAGVARPEKFLATLRATGAVVAAARWFPDHHRYTSGEIDILAREAGRLDAMLVTTEKDAARLKEPGDSSVVALGMEVVFENPDSIVATLKVLSKDLRLSRDA
ncbi:MAG: tetraacyldisaccharide 4'-kinase [Methylocystaceae bacterium]|nr:MAG: tetraacyldisaccharide 4'-kinase [Methylocystaceae bacterium]